MKKANEATTENMTIEPMKEVNAKVELIGTGDLILNKKPRSFELAEIYKQSHPKGAKAPASLNQPYSKWERLITSIHWMNPIEFHDDDHSLYTEEEWRDYMENNAPCILQNAFMGAMFEAFKSFFSKKKTGLTNLDGTDFKRSVFMARQMFPITFTSVEDVQHLVQTNTLAKTNVLATYNVFHGWKCTIEISCLESVIPRELLIDLIDKTGRYIGVGSQHLNGYGRWELGDIEIR